MKNRLFIIVATLSLVFAFQWAHDFHVSNTDMVYNESKKAYEFTIHTFNDDMLALSGGTQMDSIAIKYHVEDVFRVYKVADGMQEPMTFLGYEEDGHDFYIYFEVPVDKPQVFVENRFLISIFEEQKNIVKAKKGDKEVSLIFDAQTHKNAFLP